MHKIFEQLKIEAKKIASQNMPKFYTLFVKEQRQSHAFFFDNPLIYRLREDVLPFLLDKTGHGIDHAKKVAIDASTLILLECKKLPQKTVKRLFLLAQIAGLLHDICRYEPNHAQKGAELSLKILEEYPLDTVEKQSIAFAIQEHEAFSSQKQPKDEYQEIISAVLYDADKFRWGPDNFTTTLWEISTTKEWSPLDLKNKLPQALDFISKINTTFRTNTGMHFGPEIIECGLNIGKYMYQTLNQLENYA
ncbi:HD domain-containing protein [Desulfonauticus submarinus]|uniref:HD domain-containing protein n=1 Tax=Desulfonauticus submarinus TaxID=206665 RepID=A0A1H0CHP2_9BACT|nr:HD domain-containing protein [Desulfonauticus submarinus]SDN57385.1 HD domain-containing protein [Desulfonauticus submarinus]